MSDNASASGGPEPAVWRRMYVFDFAVGFLLPVVFCVLGIVGNVVSLAVLSSDRSATPMFITLRALAASDVVLLMGALLQQVAPVYMHVTGCAHAACLRVGYVRIYTWPVVCAAQMTSVWLTVLISAERYTAVCKPLRTYGFSDVGKIRMAIGAVVGFSAAFNSPRFFEFSAKEASLPGGNLTYVAVVDSAMRLDPVYRYLYNTAAVCLFVYAAPMAAVALLNAAIVTHIHRAKRRWSELNRQQHREVKATVMPLCIVALCFLCGTQSLVSFVLDAVFVHRDLVWIQTYTAVVNLFVIVNSAANFLVFYAFGSKFQKLLRMKIACRRRSGRYHSPLLQRRFSGHRAASARNINRSLRGTTRTSSF